MMDQKPITYWTAIEENKFKTKILFLILFLIYISFIFIISLILVYTIFGSWELVIGLNIVFSFFVIIYMLYQYRNGINQIIKELNLIPIDEYPDPYKSKLVKDIVTEIWIKSGLSLKYNLPKIYYQKTNSENVKNDLLINAFAAGTDPNNSLICITYYAIENLNREELEGLIAHEISHIGNYDTRTITTALTVGNIIFTIASISALLLKFGSENWFIFISGDERKNKQLAYLYLVILLIWILSFITSIIISFIISLISKEREYLADATAVKILNYPNGLLSVLIRIKKAQENEENIINYLKKYSDEEKKKNIKYSAFYFHDFIDSFGTHPPLEKRIERIKRMF